MSKRQGNRVKHTMKGFLSGVRKLVYPHKDKVLFAGSSSSGSRRSELMSHVEPEGSRQLRREMSEVRHIIFM
jgi:hypothetical protein